MKIRRIIEVHIPDGTTHDITRKPITEDQVLGCVTAGIMVEISSYTDADARDIHVLTERIEEGGGK